MGSLVAQVLAGSWGHSGKVAEERRFGTVDHSQTVVEVRSSGDLGHSEKFAEVIGFETVAVVFVIVVSGLVVQTVFVSQSQDLSFLPEG